MSIQTRPMDGRSINGGLMSGLKVVLGASLPLGVFALMALPSGIAGASTLYVKCGDSESGLHSISEAVKLLQNSSPSGPNTVTISGACKENVVIKNMLQLTINGVNGASITDASGGAADVVDIRDSHVTLNNLKIDGLNSVNFDAVDCEQGSFCTVIGSTIQGGADAVGAYPLSRAIIVGGTLQNNTFSGILARGGDVLAHGVLIQGNPNGITVQRGGRATANFGDPLYLPATALTPTTVINNGTGILVREGAEFLCGGCLVENSSGDGIHLDLSAAATVQTGSLANGSTAEAAITGNAGFGVYVGDLSSAAFRGSPSVAGNGQPDINCNSPTAVTRGALSAAGGSAHTNCTN